MKKLLIAMAVLFTIAGGLFANGLENKNAIGMYILGSQNAVGGIQYERRFTDLVSTKFGVYAMYNQKSNYDPFNCNFTVETDFNLYETTWKEKVSSRLFAYGMVGYIGSLAYEAPDYSVSEQENNPTAAKNPQMSNDVVLSAGFGFDFIFFDHLSLPIQFGFMGTFPDNPNVSFCGGIALRYTW